MLARAVHRGGIPGSTRSNQEAQGKNRDKDRAHDGRFQSSGARYVFGSAVDHPKLRVLHDRSIRRDNFMMPDLGALLQELSQLLAFRDNPNFAPYIQMADQILASSQRSGRTERAVRTGAVRFFCKMRRG
jgi:hypothetical protein